MATRKGGKKGGGDAERARMKKKADDIVEQTGIPSAWAWQVARGTATLQEVLTRMARQDRIDHLQRRHGIDRSTAAMIADGQLTLDDVQQRARLARHMEDNGARSILQVGAELTLHCHGLRTLTGRIEDVGPYEVVLDDGDTRHTLHKLEIKLAHAPAVSPKLGVVAEGRAAAEPIKRPQDRYHASDRRLFQPLDDATDVQLRTLEGDLVRGRPLWLSRWEICLKQSGGGEVVFLRHALAGFEVL